MFLNMAVKIALAVGLFIVICVLPGTKSSQVVPDSLVYTEVKKTLVRGAQGVLTCRFYGDPLAVYWKRGLDPDDLNIMVSWLAGEVLGPRYDDGSCDLDEDYSLIINNVSTADAGRIHCTVVNYKGVLINNYTDILVVDTAITTNPQVTLQLRQATFGILPCTVYIKARRVSWTKRTTSSAKESLVVIENNQGVADRSGAGYDKGMCNITQDYSLVIKKVQIHHEGLYVCEVTDDTGTSFRNHTFVNVVAEPLEPFPTIHECLNTEQHDSNYCILVAKSGMTLTCQAVKYYPSINLVFLYGSRVLEQSDTREWSNIDGTKNKIITIATRGNKELYSCVASSIPGTNANKSISVLLQGDEPVNSAMVVILVLFAAAVLLISSVVYVSWRKKYRYYTIVRELELQDNHSPGSQVGPQGIVAVKDLAQKVFKDVEQRVNVVLMQHHRRISDLIQMESAIQDDNIISENRTALFDTQQMLIDWQQSGTSEIKEQTIHKEHETDFGWPSNEELKTISRHLTQESMKKLCKELDIGLQCDDDNDEEKRFETLRTCKWRTKVSDEPLAKYRQLATVLESNNLRGLLPTLRGPHIYKAELVDLAFHLVVNDLFHVAKELGINVTKLVSYRPAFHSSHLEMGTIKLLAKLLVSIVGEDMLKRSIFYSYITKLHLQGVTRRGLFEYDMSYGELCSISEAINPNPEGRADQELGNLQDVLQLTDQDKADRLDNSRPLTAYALLKIWKEKPRQSVFNYRAALAHELRRIQMPDLANEIIAGKYITEQTSLAFIEDMVKRLNQDQIRILGRLLQLSKDKQQWHTTTPSNEITKQIYDWVADWTIDINVPPMEATDEKHRDINDTLIEHGFLDLAREIMIIEQQLRCKYWMDIYHDESDINDSNDRSSSSDSSIIRSISSFQC